MHIFRDLFGRKVKRYQRDNQKQYIEGQTIKWDKGTKNDLQNIT
jgi:hypothetical protein